MRKLPRREPKSVKGTFVGERPLESGGGVLKIDVQVWQGSSGSPVIDRQGDVVGMIFAKANIPAIFQKTGRSANDRAYAMPSRVLSAFLKRKKVEPRRPANSKAPASPGDYLVRVDCFH